MPTITAQKIVDDAKTILQDTTGIRWQDPELLRWLSAGQREIAALVPSAFTRTVAFTPVTGVTRQTIPSDGHVFIDAPMNLAGAGAPITAIPKHLMDTLQRNWRTFNANATGPLHYVFDPRNPKEFIIWPPAPEGHQIELIYGAIPGEITSLAQVIGLDDIYANPLTDYVLYRAYSKDLETVGSAERAVGHRQAFENTLGLRAQAAASNQPVAQVK